MSMPVPVQAQDLESATCECCGLTEECTSGYVNKIRERHLGRWICGLCAEAVRYEMYRSGWNISIEEAIDQHVRFLERFKTGVASSDVASEGLIQAVGKLLRRSLDSPRVTVGERDDRTSRELERSRSCFAALGRS